MTLPAGCGQQWGRVPGHLHGLQVLSPVRSSGIAGEDEGEAASGYVAQHQVKVSLSPSDIDRKS